MNHMSCEMLDQNHDEKVDIYAFGMCLYELATGQEPYNEGKNMGQVVQKIPLASETERFAIHRGRVAAWHHTGQHLAGSQQTVC
jgi:serine/threonine protein kinase